MELYQTKTINNQQILIRYNPDAALNSFSRLSLYFCVSQAFRAPNRVQITIPGDELSRRG